jgi:hypothetical protein
MQPEPHIELMPIRQRILVWTIATIGPWVFIASTARVLGWW